MGKIFNRKKLKKFRKELRNNSTSAETELWKYLKNKQIGIKFRRQHSIENYILDFYCVNKKLCIEIDGAGHFDLPGEQRDEKRDDYLMKKYGIKTLRIENFDVFDDIYKVIKRIIRECKK